MSHTASLVNSILTDTHRSSRPVYEQLREGLREMILGGQVPTGSRLPSSRRWAEDIGVSRMTITRVYDELTGEGFLERVQGSGTYVSNDLSAFVFGRGEEKGRALATSEAKPGASVSARATSGRTIRTSHLPPQAQPLPFRPGAASFGDFPIDTWSRYVLQAWRKSPKALAMDYGPTIGYRPLREQISQHLSVTRGVRCVSEQVIVTSGSPASLALAARTLSDPGQIAWVEDPGSPEARGVLSAAGLNNQPVNVDADGFDLERAIAVAPSPALACVSPSYQFPTGVIMSMRRRMELLEESKSRGFWVLEHDLDSDFRYSGRSLRALQGIDRIDQVVYIGSFTRSMYPGIRLGYLVVPRGIVEVVTNVLEQYDWVPPMATQIAMASFMADGHLARHIRRMRVSYMSKRDRLVAALNDVLGGESIVAAPDAGMHVPVELPDRVSIDDVIAELRSRAVESLPGRNYSQSARGDNQLVLGFAAGSAREFARAITVLRQVLTSALG